MRLLKPLQQTGDTIVEVMIVIIVLGVVITTGYNIAVRSLQSMQLAQEKSYALKIAEGQLENLKAATEVNPAILSQANGYCVDGTLADHDISNGSPTVNFADEVYANYPTECKNDVNNNGCVGLCYYYGIKAVGDNSITATVRWDGYSGKRQQVQLSYRIYP